MFKRGICTVNDLIAAERSLKRRYFRPDCYIGLYEEVMAINGNGYWQELILSPFAVRDTVFKRTTSNRFNEFDSNTLELLRESAPLRESCVVHDMAVSDARTACYFFDKLARELGDELEFYATDLCLKVYSVHQPGGRLTVVIDADERILQIVLPPFVLPVAMNDRWLLYPVNRLVRAVLMQTIVKRVMRLLRDGSGALERREILLLCQEAREHLQRYPNFHVEIYDALEIPQRKYGVVRAMNIFNRTYFPDHVLVKAVGNVFVSLNEGGIFITGSNQDAGSMVNGSVYRKCGGRFVPTYKSALGSPVDHIITGFRVN
jgi:hypothetical protein